MNTTTQRFTTNLRCEGCVTAIKPFLDADPAIKSWSAEVLSPEKVITLESDQPLSLATVNVISAPPTAFAFAVIVNVTGPGAVPEPDTVATFVLLDAAVIAEPGVAV